MSKASAGMKFLATLLLCLAAAAPALAVSLGDELILSRLGDPVEIEIEVLQWEDMDLDRVEITAATREEYEVFNLTWLPVLENLDFNLVGPDLDGDVRVLISSRDPLNEPFLELLLVLRWPGGSLRREYVLLFDPPGLALTTGQASDAAPVADQRALMTVPQLPPEDLPVPGEDEVSEPQVVALVATDPLDDAPVANPGTFPAEAPRTNIAAQDPPATASAASALAEPVEAAAPAAVEPAPDVADETTSPPLEPKPEPAPPDREISDARTQVAIEVETLAPQPAQAPLDTARRTYQVRSGDSLWNIARQFRPAGAGDNIYQMLLGIHDLNRGSFINGNISLLKANALLQMPTTNDIGNIDPLTAEAEFDRRWSAGTQRYDAVQRGEAIPLFANEAPVEEAVPFEEELPPGAEAPPPPAGESDLILVSETNAPQPLQIPSDALDASGDYAAEPVPESEALPGSAGEDQIPPTEIAGEIATGPAIEPGMPGEAVVAPGNASELANDVAMTRDSEPVRSFTVVSRAEFAAQLETELAAMRTRRESAEAIAQQLQATLEQAKAKRAADTSLLVGENLLLAGGAVGLLVALVAGIVTSLKLAGELRMRDGIRSRSALAERAEPSWPAANGSAKEIAAAPTGPTLRQEPVLPEMDVVELPPGTNTDTSRSLDPAKPDDLFARMDDILGSDSKPLQK